MKKLVLGLVIFSFLLGTISLADGRTKGRVRGDKGKDKYAMILKEAGVDAATSEKIKALSMKSREESKKMKKQIEEKRKQLRELFNQKDLDEAKIIALAQEIGELNKQKLIQRTNKNLEAAKLLTPEQREKIKKIKQNHAKKRSNKRPGRRPNKRRPVKGQTK